MDHIAHAKDTLTIEIEGLQNAVQNLDRHFENAINALLKCTGKVIISGMGKSGLVGQKIAATLASTGTSSFFMHPGEALHGDLGMVSPEDAVILLSYSGETEELLRMLAFLKEGGNLTLSITGKPESTLAQNTQFHINAAVPREACPLQLAPTASTTATLALGDAIAMCLMHARGFKAEDFARFHPGGSLGRKLLTKVGHVMRTENLPFAPSSISPQELLIKMSEGKLGLALMGSAENLEGIITDGDLRRALIEYGSLAGFKVKEIMTRNPVKADANDRLSDVETLMRERKITAVPVFSNGKVTGVLQLF